MKRSILRILSLVLVIAMISSIPVFAATAYRLKITITGPKYDYTDPEHGDYTLESNGTGTVATTWAQSPRFGAGESFLEAMAQVFLRTYDGNYKDADGRRIDSVDDVFTRSSLHQTVIEGLSKRKNDTEWKEFIDKTITASYETNTTTVNVDKEDLKEARTLSISKAYNDAEKDHTYTFVLTRSSTDEWEYWANPEEKNSYDDAYTIIAEIETVTIGGNSSTPVETNPVVVVNESTTGSETGTDQNTVDTSTDSATSGSRIIVTPKPQPGYKLQNLTVTDAYGNKVPTTKNPDGTFSFTMPDSQVNIRPTFIRVPESPEVTGTNKLLNTGDHILYLIGYPDGSVQPMGNITRAEVCMAFYRLLKNQNVETTVSYPDVKDGAWFAEAVKVISTLNIANGYPDGTFKPNQAITRAEFTAIATRFAEAKGGDVTFKDVPADYWAKDNIATAAVYGWINGYEDGTYRPANLITRAEAATIINHMLGREADGAFADANKTSLEQFTDLQDNSMWYYYDMVEATNAHDFTKSAGSEIWTKLNK